MQIQTYLRVLAHFENIEATLEEVLVDDNDFSSRRFCKSVQLFSINPILDDLFLHPIMDEGGQKCPPYRT